MSRCEVALATPKSMIFGAGFVVLGRHQDVRRLEVAMDDPLLVRVLHALADVDEQRRAARGCVSRCLSQYSVIGIPCTYSIAK